MMNVSRLSLREDLEQYDAVVDYYEQLLKDGKYISGKTLDMLSVVITTYINLSKFSAHSTRNETLVTNRTFILTYVSRSF